MLRDLKRSLFIALTSFKPGSIHRFVTDLEFELRLLESIELLDAMEVAYKRGRDLALGNIDTRSLGIGVLISDTARRSYEITGQKPLIGLMAAAISLSTLDGYISISKERILDSIGSLLTRTIYRTPAQDARQLVELAEDVGLSKYVDFLADSGFTKESIEYENRTLGDLFELLSKIDTGFMLNLRDYSYLLRLSKDMHEYKNMMLASVKAYLTITGDILNVEEMKGIDLHDQSFLSKLSTLDKKYRKLRDKLEGAVGGVFISLYFLNNQKEPLNII
ncbi:MAG: hypothetical protein G5Z42_03790 [Caldisphaeraceae archaeon]|nr:hypothetical protein [Caldisphaeraceae archaeon]MEB3692145.1 hypothetical protein [Caldisphaeraceae archaeon]MEB3797928.1 hypothetical protein [Caldisphaeraceae archaeon]